MSRYILQIAVLRVTIFTSLQLVVVFCEGKGEASCPQVKISGVLSFLDRNMWQTRKPAQEVTVLLRLSLLNVSRARIVTLLKYKGMEIFEGSKF